MSLSQIVLKVLFERIKISLWIIFFKGVILVLFFGLLLGCSTSKDSVNTNQTAISTASESSSENALKLAFSGLNRVEGRLAFTYILQNEGPDSILILKPRPIVEYGDFVPANVPPEFFKLQVLPTNVRCEYAVENSGTDDIKTLDDFDYIAPGSTYSFSINPAHFNAEICDESIAEVKTVLSYKFDERYLEKSFFEARVKQKGNLSQAESDQLFQMLQKTYRNPMQTDTISLEMEAFMR